MRAKDAMIKKNVCLLRVLGIVITAFESRHVNYAAERQNARLFADASAPCACSHGSGSVCCLMRLQKKKKQPKVKTNSLADVFFPH